jgi:hypothetical protein
VPVESTMRIEVVDLISQIMSSLNLLFTVLHSEGATNYIPPGIYMGAMDVLDEGSSQVDALFLGNWAEA